MTNSVFKSKPLAIAIPAVAGALSILAGFIVLLGWHHNIESLKTIVAGTISMKPNTALTFILIGFTLLLSLRPTPRARRGARILSILIIFIGIFSLNRYLFNWNLGFENVIFREPSGTAQTIYPGLMAFGTAVNFILLATALFLTTIPAYKNLFVVRFFAIFSFSVSILALLGYITGYEELAGPGSFTKMAINTAGLFVILSTGILNAIPIRQGSQASIERRLFTGLTVSIAIVIFVSFLAIEGMDSLQKSSKQNAHSDEILDQINEITIRVEKIQSSARKYALSGEEYYRKSHQIGVLHLSKILDTLHLDEVDNVYIRKAAAISKRLALSDTSILFKKLKEIGSSASLAAVSKENETTDSIHALMGKIYNAEKQTLSLRNQSGKTLAVKTRATIITGIVIQLLLIFFLFLYVKRDVAGRKRAENSLRELNENLEFLVVERTNELHAADKKYHDMVENSPLGICNTSIQGKVLFANQAFADLMEYDSIAQVIEETSISFYKKVEDRTRFLELLTKNGRVEKFEAPALTKKSNTKDVLLNSWLDKDIIYTTVIDITDQKKAQEKLKNAARLYALLSSTNEVIVRVKERKILFEEACRIAVDEGKFMMAWIGMLDEQINKVLPVASAGVVDDYLASVNVDLNDEVRKRGIVAKAVLEGVHYVALDIANNPDSVPWRENALNQGYKSLGCFPITVFGKTIGAFMLYADEAFFFDSEGLVLLDEVTNDISFAIETIENDTKRKEYVEELRNSEQRFRSTLDSMLEGCQILGRDWRYRYINDTAENHNRRPKEELLGYKYMDMWPGIMETEVFRVVKNCMELRVSRYMENEFTFPDGARGWFELRIEPVPEGVFILSVDITDRKLSQGMLQASEERFRSVFENSPIGNSLTTLNGKLDVNKEFCKIVGYSVEELSSMNWEKITHPDDIEEGRQASAALLAGKTESVRFQKRYIHKSGKIVWVDMSVSLQRDEAGNPIFFISSASNITDLKLAEMELIKAKEKAEEMNRLKTNFLGTMSHELRTPLIGILGFSEILGDEIENTEQMKMAKTINESGERLKTTLNMILDLSKIEAKQLQLINETCNIVPIVQSCVNNYAEMAQKKGLYLKTVIMDANLVTVLDKRIIPEILNHLLKNAVTYTDAGGITVTVTKETGDTETLACISISDTGIGIAKENFGLIFEEFRQVSEGLSRGFEGTGLGLTLVKKYIDLMNGSITLESELGIGSTFTVKFPVPHIVETKGEMQMHAQDVSTDQTTLLKTLPVFLYVEDDDVSRNVVKRMLEDLCVVEFATSGPEALALVKKQQFDGILMDINLGKGIDGVLVTKELRKMPRYESTPIIALTAFAMTGDKDEFLEAGCTDYISKPFSRNELIAKVKEYIR